MWQALVVWAAVMVLFLLWWHTIVQIRRSCDSSARERMYQRSLWQRSSDAVMRPRNMPPCATRVRMTW